MTTCFLHTVLIHRRIIKYSDNIKCQNIYYGDQFCHGSFTGCHNTRTLIPFINAIPDETYNIGIVNYQNGKIEIDVESFIKPTHHFIRLRSLIPRNGNNKLNNIEIIKHETKNFNHIGHHHCLMLEKDSSVCLSICDSNERVLRYIRIDSSATQLIVTKYY